MHWRVPRLLRFGWSAASNHHVHASYYAAVEQMAVSPQPRAWMGRPCAASERVQPRQRPADRELMDGFRTLVGDDTFEVQHVSDGDVFGAYTGSAQEVASVAGDVQRHAAVVPFREGDLGGLQRV